MSDRYQGLDRTYSCIFSEVVLIIFNFYTEGGKKQIDRELH